MQSTPSIELAPPSLDGHPDPAFTIDSNGAVGWLNAAARAWWTGPDGAPMAHLDDLGLPVTQLPPGASTLDVPLRSNAAAPQWCRLGITAPAQGQRLITLTPVHDLRRQAERAGHLAEQLEVAQEFGRLGVWERDTRTLAGHWDRHTFGFWGLSETAGTPDFERALQAIVPEDRDGLERAFLESTRRAGTYSRRYRVRHTDGTTRHLHSQWVVRNGPDGRPQRALGVMVDDTQAWELARLHDAAQRQLATAVDVGQIAIWRHDLASHQVHCNDVAVRLLGLDGRTTPVALDELLARIHPHDLAAVRASAQQALEQTEPVDFEFRVRRFDGLWGQVHTRRVVERDAQGKPLAFLGVSMDVTVRRDEARLTRELLRRFNLAARTAGIGHWSLEHGATRARWSDQLRAMHGLPPGSEVPAMRDWLARHVHADDRAMVLQSYHDWVRSGRSSHDVEFRILRRDGGIAHLVAHSRVEGEGGSALLFGIVIDVTERRRAEAALRAAAERAALIARGVGLGTWELDLRSGQAHWDEQMWLVRGLAPRQGALSADERLALVHPDDRAIARAVQDRLERETGPIDFEFRVRWPDGQWRWLASRSVALCDAQGHPVRRIGVNWDVTDARSAVAEREERVAAQREVQAKSRFLARMSHELRTPLNAVLGFTQLLMAEDATAEHATRARRLEHIWSAGRHLLSLIDDVLELSRLEGGEVAIDLKPAPLAPLIEGLLPLVEQQADRAGVRVRCGAMDVVPLADATRLSQVLLNLLTNAIKYNRAGGDVIIDASAAEGVVALSVSDSGRGMSPQQMRHLFEPFNRLGAEASGVEGTGIGLAIVKALVERMGGTVHVESVLGRGTRVELRLPDGRHADPVSIDRASPQAMALAVTSGRVGHGGTVLYIEDNPVNTLIVGELIAQRPDLTLHTAVTGEAGLALAREVHPDLVLLDMQLPDIDGIEVFARLQAERTTASIPCIALSANAMPADIQRAMRSGFADYWTKPLDFRTFTASIEALFGPPP